MSFNNNGFNNNGFINNGLNNNESFIRHICRYIGQTVIVFTTSGGVSGSGFTGVLLSVGCDTLRIDSRQGFAPACPLGTSFSGNSNNCDCYGNDNNYDNRENHHNNRSVGSVCDIPIDSIAAFCHNAI